MRSTFILLLTILLINTSINLQAQNEETVFDRYPWLIEYVNPNNCNGEKITVFIYFLITKVYVETENSSYVFYDDGKINCEPQDEAVLDEPCLEIVSFNDGTSVTDDWEVVETWECGGIVTSNETIQNYLIRNRDVFFFRIGTELNAVDLSSTGPFTVFVPTNEAFINAFPNAESFPLIGYPANFGTTIDNHIVQGNYLITDLFDGQVLTTVTGETLLVTINENGTFINDVQIIEDGYETTNGIVYSIDKVLLVEKILGCTNPKALNFNSIATQDDDSCEFPEVYGCRDPEAINYNASAIQDDGNCVYFDPVNTISNELFELFPWLSDKVNTDNCRGVAITVYYESENPFVYVETLEKSVLYYYDGTIWCEDDSQVVVGCRTIYGLDRNAVVWNCGEEADLTVFEQFSWLNTIIDETNCNNTTATVYNKYPFQYVFVETQTGNTLYFQNGTEQCADRSGLDCREFYNLNTSATVWNCEGESAQEEVEQEESGQEDLEQQEPSTEIFEEFSWLTTIVDETNCNNTTTTVYNKGTFQYIFVETENGGTLYFEDGTKYCTDRSGLNCREFYGLTERTMEWSCGEELGQEEVEQPEISVDIFEEFSWLRSVLDDSSCEGTTARVYNTGAFQYVFIETSDGGTLYFEDGTRYCGNRSNLNCEEFYGLEEVSATWLCEGGGKNLSNSGIANLLANTNANNYKTGLSNQIVSSFDVKIYPNPTSNYLNIEFIKPVENNLTINLYNVSGKLIKTENTTDNLKLYLTTQINGIYLLELRNENKIEHHKIVKY